MSHKKTSRFQDLSCFTTGASSSVNMASATTVSMAFVLKIYWQECPRPLLSSKDPYPSFHPESQLLGTSGAGSGTLFLNVGKQNIWRSSSRAERRPGTNGWIQVWVSFCHWANLLSLPWFYFVSNLGIQAPHQDGNKFYREQCSHHREPSSTGDKVIACMSQEDYSSAWNEPVVAGKVRRITQKQVQESGKMGFKHWENLTCIFASYLETVFLWKYCGSNQQPQAAVQLS